MLNSHLKLNKSSTFQNADATYCGVQCPYRKVLDKPATAMTRIILLSILITVVYSWEEFKRTMRVLVYQIFRKRKPSGHYSFETDKLVSILVMLGSIPIGLTYFLASEEDIWAKLSILFAGFVVIALVAAGSAIFLRRIRLASSYEGVVKLVPLGFSLAGFLTPTFRVFGDAFVLPRSVLAKFAFWLSLPPAVGLILKYATDLTTPEILIPNIDALIKILMAVLFAQITAEFLGRYLRIYNLRRLFSYARIVLGIILAVILLAGFAK